jgi:replication factor A1
MVSTSVMEVNPDIPQSHSLKGWYVDGGADTSFQAFSRDGGASGAVNRNEMRTLNDAKNSNVDTSEKPEYFSARATVMNVKPDNIAYPACPKEGCNKKVIEDPSENQWRCEKCDRLYPAPEYRLSIALFYLY